MKSRVRWHRGVSFVAQSGTGNSVLMDGPPEAGGENLGPRPMEMLLMGLGGCSAYDVVVILRKARQRLHDCVVDISAERAESVPKVFTKIHLHFVVTGVGLSENQVKRAVNLSADKYCSASRMLAKTAEITHDYEVIEVEGS